MKRVTKTVSAKKQPKAKVNKKVAAPSVNVMDGLQKAYDEGKLSKSDLKMWQKVYSQAPEETKTPTKRVYRKARS